MKNKEIEKYSSHPYLLKTYNIEKLILFSGISISSEVLDLCCGAAHSAILFSKFVKNIIGIDNDEKILEKAKKNILNQKIKNITIQFGNAEKLGFKDESFDVVIGRGAFRHINNYPMALDECYRVLKPNGKLFLAEIILPGEFVELWEEISKVRTGNKKHYWPYNFLLKKMREAGFEPLLIIPTNHKQDLDKWLNEIEEEEKKKYYKEKILNLNNLNDLHFSSSEPYFFIYDLIELLLEKQS